MIARIIFAWLYVIFFVAVARKIDWSAKRDKILLAVCSVLCVLLLGVGVFGAC